jgi:hypothetical protein
LLAISGNLTVQMLLVTLFELFCVLCACLGAFSAHNSTADAAWECCCSLCLRERCYEATYDAQRLEAVAPGWFQPITPHVCQLGQPITYSDTWPACMCRLPKADVTCMIEEPTAIKFQCSLRCVVFVQPTGQQGRSG